MRRDREWSSTILADARPALVAVDRRLPTRGPRRPRRTISLHVSWGHRSPPNSLFTVRLTGDGVSITRHERQRPGAGGRPRRRSLADGRRRRRRRWRRPHARMSPTIDVKDRESLHPIWRDLIAQSDPDTARRLRLDPAFRHDPRKLTIRMDREGTTRIQRDRRSAPPEPGSSGCLRSISTWRSASLRSPSRGTRTNSASGTAGASSTRSIGSVKHRYDDFTARWEDMGSPSYVHPRQTPPGHIVGLSWDSAIPKFGIDRGGGVWSDLGTPDRFRSWVRASASLTRDLKRSWKGQRLADGLPVLRTILEETESATRSSSSPIP